MKPATPWIPIERISKLIQFEPVILITLFVIMSWLLYRLFLRRTSMQRHESLRKLFRNQVLHLISFASLVAGYSLIVELNSKGAELILWQGYVGLGVLISGGFVVVKTVRILVFEYLFLIHMKVGVPVLLVNLSSLFLYVFIAGWILTEVFKFQVAPLLATSAIFSLVLGLALQDTLGNLFAGVALQLDKPFEIGDWIEVQTPTQKWVGQVHELSWRGTTLIGIMDETLVIPNRVVSQAEIANFSNQTRPFARREVVRVPYGTPLSKAKEALLRAAKSQPEICEVPEPLVIFAEMGESWMTLRLVYFIKDYGHQWQIADRVNTRVIEELAHEGIDLASPRLKVELPKSQNTSSIV